MKLKKLEDILGQLDFIDDFKISLEQYNTSSHIVAQIIYSIHTTYDDLNNKLIADFGCGSGMFAIASALIANCECYGIDCDKDALDISHKNIVNLGIESQISLIQADILGLNNLFKLPKPFDIVIMNPPFGTKNNKGTDMNFLNMATKMASQAVYSLHKTSTRKYILKQMNKPKMKCEVLAQIHFDIPSCYNFHKRKW